MHMLHVLQQVFLYLSLLHLSLVQRWALSFALLLTRLEMLCVIICRMMLVHSSAV